MRTGKRQPQTLTDRLDPARARALHETLGLDGSAPDVGDALPPFWHQIYFWDPMPPQDLGYDGHADIGDLIPDMGLPRRMWAGGRLQFHAPLIAGVQAQKMTHLKSSARKSGRSGDLAFVTLRHEIRQRGALVVSEDQDLVYRPADAGPAQPPDARADEDVCEEMLFSTVMLFRYSALTLNGHRIHYDQAFAEGSEGYPGLVVHGPLLAQILMLLATARLGPLTGFTFRATAPLFHTETASFCAKGQDFWVRGPDGRACMVARAEPV
jgi:3-methylfumaryl-CoA hydratase